MVSGLLSPECPRIWALKALESQANTKLSDLERRLFQFDDHDLRPRTGTGEAHCWPFQLEFHCAPTNNDSTADMQQLRLPPLLLQEFATIAALWDCGAETRRVDAFLLAWVKYEKQLRRLFCYLVYQHPEITTSTIKHIMLAMADNNRLYPQTFINGIGRWRKACSRTHRAAIQIAGSRS